jgi:hypothetical protein
MSRSLPAWLRLLFVLVLTVPYRALPPAVAASAAASIPSAPLQPIAERTPRDRWRHHIPMALLAGAFLLSLQLEWGAKMAPDHPAVTYAGLTRLAATAYVDAGRIVGLAT